ncbi:2-hydroxyacid dehydrogenase [Curtobacterium sp. RRHDQ10]|uniref:2-hydroxyacid dehydrogenase n=1 Tax=Curtobacterium phyllosphaerae TaxID=3413379 RepID=UPI003BF361C0
MPRILLAGDHFVTPALFRDALTAHVDPAVPVEYDDLTLPWPYTPFGDVDGVHEASGSAADLIDALHETDVVVTQMAPFTADVFAARPALRMVSVCRGGPVNVDLAAATAAGVIVTYAPGRNAQAAAEFAVGLMLTAMRRISDGDRELRAGRWRGDYYAYSEVGVELGAATVGLVGYGAIGRIVARILQAFGSTVIAYDPYADPDALQRDGVRGVALPELLGLADVVSLHARLTPETRHIIAAGELGLMRRGAVIVNSARGDLLDYDALPALLADGSLAAAAFDVFDVEPPPPGWPLLRAGNVVATPHLAGATKQTAQRAADIVATDVATYLRGDVPEHVANPAVLDRIAR